jgi:hypothetical protein
MLLVIPSSSALTYNQIWGQEHLSVFVRWFLTKYENFELES